MRLTPEEKKTITGFCCLIVALFLFFSVFLIPTKGRFIQSARVMPTIVSGVMVLLSFLLFIRSLCQARPTPSLILSAMRKSLSSPGGQNTVLSIALTAFYVFVGVPHIGFYVSSAALIMFIGIYYVRRIHPAASIAASLGITFILYLTFTVLFQMPLR
jgi:hypothetical protein